MSKTRIRQRENKRFSIQESNPYRGLIFVPGLDQYAAYAEGRLIGYYLTLQDAMTARNIAEQGARNDASQ